LCFILIPVFIAPFIKLVFYERLSDSRLSAETEKNPPFIRF